jgi:NodT family efflux transporter outer membrane factor (OMF) lipoprotein
MFIIAGPILSILMLFSGCTVGPDYSPPDPNVSAQWNSPLEGGLADGTMDPQTLASWWTIFEDGELTSLIQRAVAGNLDVKAACARLRQARAARGIAEADQFPTLDASGAATWTRSGDESGDGKTTDMYSVGFDAGWEIDLFGGIRRAIEAADADLQATQEDLHDVLVTLVSELALNYVEVRTYQSRLAAVNANIESQSETYQLVRWESEAGLSDELTVQQARYNLEGTRSEISDLHSGLQAAMNRIAVLLGEQPGTIHKELETVEPIPAASPTVAVGVPADVLRQRPDIRKAERELASQTAQVGVAVAELYPKLKLNGSIGIDAASLSRLSQTASTFDNWTLSGGPQISWTVFDGGAVRRNIEVQSALQEQALIHYETTVLEAFEEVENAMTAYVDEQNKYQHLREAADAARQAAELAMQKYQAGLTDFTDVLESQRSVLSFQNQQAQSRGTITSNLIRLYKVFGGGWTSSACDTNLISYCEGK